MHDMGVHLFCFFELNTRRYLHKKLCASVMLLLQISFRCTYVRAVCVKYSISHRPGQTKYMCQTPNIPTPLPRPLGAAAGSPPSRTRLPTNYATTTGVCTARKKSNAYVWKTHPSNLDKICERKRLCAGGRHAFLDDSRRDGVLKSGGGCNNNRRVKRGSGDDGDGKLGWCRL